MKRLAILMVLASLTAVAQNATQQPTPDSNLKARIDQVTYTDVNCSGYLTPEKYSRANYVAGGLYTPNAVRYADREYIYLAGGGYAVGNEYTIIREVQDANKFEIYPGQTKLVEKVGHLYGDVAHVKVSYIEGEIAVAEVNFSCETAVPGDLVIPFKERPVIKLTPRADSFQRFQKFNGGVSGRIVMGKGFDDFLGIGQKVYMDIGSSKGIKPGDYLRITRNYDPDQIPPIDKIGINASELEDSQKDPAKIKISNMKKLPYHGIGELVVLSVTDTTATGMITKSVEDVQPGDVVEVISNQ
jgi:hypothetical protein